jgi:hypothetical protein
MQQEQLSKLSVLPVNKTVVFYSPIEGKDVLVRTGTIPDGSCVYHSLLHAYSKDYISMDEQGRKKLVNRLRGSLNKVDKERWEQLSDGLVAKIPFQENVNVLLTEFYKHVQDGKSCKTKGGRRVVRKLVEETDRREDRKEETNAYKLVLEMVTLTDFEKRILPQTYDSCGDDSVKVCKEKLITNAQDFYKKIFDSLKGKVDDKRIQFCVKKLTKLLEIITNEAEDNAFNEYVSNLKDASVEMDKYTIELISTRLNRDIFFLDSGNRMPFNLGTKSIQKRKTIILLWTGGSHYEVVGRLLPGNKIQREFESDDPLIVRMRTFLCNPERISSDYPNLIPYLSKEHRRSRSRSVSRSRSRSRSAEPEKRKISRSHSERSKRSGSSKHSKHSKRSGSRGSRESNESNESSESSESSEESSESSESSRERRKKKDRRKTRHHKKGSDNSSSEHRDALTWLGHSSPSPVNASPKESRKEKIVEPRPRADRGAEPALRKKAISPVKERKVSPVKERKISPVKESRKEKTERKKVSPVKIK